MNETPAEVRTTIADVLRRNGVSDVDAMAGAIALAIHAELLCRRPQLVDLTLDVPEQPAGLSPTVLEHMTTSRFVMTVVDHRGATFQFTVQPAEGVRTWLRYWPAASVQMSPGLDLLYGARRGDPSARDRLSVWTLPGSEIRQEPW